MWRSAATSESRTTRCSTSSSSRSGAVGVAAATRSSSARGPMATRRPIRRRIRRRGARERGRRRGRVSEVASGADDVGPAILLPEAVRQRLVAMTLEVLDSVGDLPASLRPVMGFAPQRRTRLAAGPIAVALQDDDFRSKVAGQIRPGRADLIAALESGEPVAADPVEAAAVAYLVRPDGWQRTLAQAVSRLDESAPAAASREEELARLRQQVEETRAEFADVRERLRQQVTQLKADNADLRR